MIYMVSRRNSDATPGSELFCYCLTHCGHSNDTDHRQLMADCDGGDVLPKKPSLASSAGNCATAYGRQSEFTLPATSSRSAFANHGHLSGSSARKAAGHACPARRPLRPLGFQPKSGGNKLDTCHSAGERSERQFLHLANSHTRPKAVPQVAPKRPLRRVPNFGVSLPQTGRWATRDPGHLQPVTVAPKQPF